MKRALNGIILATVITMSAVAQAPPPAQVVDVERIALVDCDAQASGVTRVTK